MIAARIAPAPSATTTHRENVLIAARYAMGAYVLSRRPSDEGEGRSRAWVIIAIFRIFLVDATSAQRA